MSFDDQEQLFGAGVRGLLRFLVRYRHLHPHLLPEERKKRLRTFLLRHYTDWGIREIAGVYECLCDIIVSRFKMGGRGIEELDDLCAALIVDLDVLRIPGREPERWVRGVERKAGRGDLLLPVDEALGRLKRVSEGEEGEEDWSEEEEGVTDEGCVVEEWEVRGIGQDREVPSPGVLEKLGARIEAVNTRRQRALAFGAAL
jgi:hypothetical protein